ncbi:SusC/RagA family TonB-linked outer membrane protein [Desertivirga xinjiangensis]|uniref:SusC/RagA family TonB-linked outer membrane protein n=1 Tax=Desertivirga xinjiangensis TaxID=539206 RepID=UPI002109CBFB|nr:TonB-dependent receptor [Pedobacter xinjiangensis]
MRVSGLLYFILAISANILQASTGKAQALNKRITVSYTQKNLYEIILDLQDRAQLDFGFTQGLGLEKIKVPKAEFNNERLEDVLKDLFSRHNVEFTESNGTVILNRKQQPGRIAGRVTDNKGEPLAGASLRIKELSRSFTTDSEGRYSVAVNPGTYTLEVHFISFGTQERKLEVQAGKTVEAVFSLTPQGSALNEVVVIGYGEVKKKDLTGSVVSIDIDKIKDTPVLSVDLALQGRIPGADIMASTGEPGAPASIRIRGTRSISATNEPLIVVDGVIDGISNLADINMADIASVSVLKDASATAIYGTRGSNGVIIITTKQGRKGKDDITVKSVAGISQLPRRLDIMNAAEFAQYRNDVAFFSTSDNYGEIGSETPQSAYPYPDPLSRGKGTDWVEQISRTAHYHNHLVSLSGGAKKTNYYASFAYDNTQGIIDKSGVKRFTGRLNLDYQLFPWMKTGYKYNYTGRDDDQNLVTIGGTNWWSAAIYLNPLIQLRDNFNDLWYSGQRFNSPRAVLDYGVIRNAKRNGNTHTGYVDIEPLKGLKLNSQLTYYQYQLRTFRYEPGTLPAKSVNEGGTAYRGEFNESNLMSQTTLAWLKDWNRTHHVDMTAGFIAQKRGSDNLTLQGEGYQSDDVTWNNMNAIPDKENYSASSSNTEKVAMSFLARANYNYKSKYYLTVTGRRDGASNFAANQKWAFFPSAALKWSISNENFMKKVDWINDLSLRLSAGRTGNDGISSYRSLSALASTTGGYLFNGSQPVAFYPSRLASQNLSWEKTDMYNIATDISLFKNRVNMVLEGYVSYTSDLLLDVQVPTQTGYSTRFANVGKTSNKGVEFSIETRNIEKRNFSWSSSFSVSHNAQKVEDIGTLDYVNVYGAYGNNSYMMYGYVQDYPLNALWGFKYGGTWKSQEEINRNKITKAYVSASNPQYTPGSARYLDTNHDGVFNEQDLVYLGNADPYLYGGLQNNFRYKKLSLGVFIAYSLGGKIYNISEQWMGNGSINTNQYRFMLDAWHPVRNPGSDLPRAGSADAIASDRMVYDASFLRLKTVSLGYTFDIHKLTRNTLRDVQFVLTGENLLLWKKYNGFDPDVSSESGTSTLRRLDIGAYPKPRTITASVQIRY